MVLPFKDSNETAEPRGARASAIKLPDTPRWSEARPRQEVFDDQETLAFGCEDVLKLAESRERH